MKKIFYLLSSLMLVFTACDPMDEVYEELDKIAENAEDKAVVNLTFVQADYQTFKDHAHVSKHFYFASEDEAIELIPGYLKNKYSYLGNGATVYTTVKLQMFPGINTTVASSDTYALVEADYDVTGDGRFDNFNSASDLETFLKYKYPSAVENQVVVLTFDYYLNGTKTTLTDSFYYRNGAWVNIYHVTADDYTSVGKRSDFSSSDDAVLSEYFNKFLKDRVFGAKAGDLQYVSYAYYNSSTRKVEQRVMAMAYNGSVWNTASASATEETTLKFKKENGEWNVDFTVEYTLVNADYTWIGITNTNPNYGTETNRANLAQYRSYYTQTPGDSRYWSQEEITKSLIALVKNKYPNPKKGVKYKLFYKVYSGATETTSITLKPTENGGYEVI